MKFKAIRDILKEQLDERMEVLKVNDDLLDDYPGVVAITNEISNNVEAVLPHEGEASRPEILLLVMEFLIGYEIEDVYSLLIGEYPYNEDEDEDYLKNFCEPKSSILANSWKLDDQTLERLLNVVLKIYSMDLDMGEVQICLLDRVLKLSASSRNKLALFEGNNFENLIEKILRATRYLNIETMLLLGDDILELVELDKNGDVIDLILNWYDKYVELGVDSYKTCEPVYVESGSCVLVFRDLLKEGYEFDKDKLQEVLEGCRGSDWNNLLKPLYFVAINYLEVDGTNDERKRFFDFWANLDNWHKMRISKLVFNNSVDDSDGFNSYMKMLEQVVS